MKFHSHITVVNINSIPKGWKRTDIFLEDKNRQQTDIMLTKHYMIGKAGIESISNIVEDTKTVCKLLKGIRYKVEQDDSFNRDITEKEYFECHIKLLERSDIFLEGFKRSSNPRQKIGEDRVFFWNKRWYSGNVVSIIDDVREITNKYGKSILECKLEHVLVDSRHELDKWWA